MIKLYYNLIMNQIKSLIQQLVSEAKARGISQAQLAELSGLTAVGLSKAKSRGDIRASTLAEMAAQLNLELIIAPQASNEKTAEAIKSGNFFDTSGSNDDDGS